MKKRPELILASYVTYKELYRCDKYRSPYQILGEFVKYIIYEKKLYVFSAIDMKKHIDEIFGFKLPNAVLKTTLRKVDCVEKAKEHEEFLVDYEKLEIDVSFKDYKDMAEKSNLQLIEKLIDFTEKRMNCLLSSNDKQQLSMEFMAYLLDESNGGKYQDSISTFILKHSEDTICSNQMKSIREGCILYTGINYNIDEIGSITDKLTLYLDTEIMFDLYGYNGSVFKNLAGDMIKLIQDANSKKKNIQLRFFQETKKEVDDSFLKAEEIVTKKTLLKENVAMKEIVKNCKDATDVLDKKTDFFHKMKYTYGIIEDEEKEYYDEEKYEMNLEGIELEGVDCNDSATEQSIRYISNINKLRKNARFFDYLKSGYLIVTETGRTLELSKKITDKLKKEEFDDEKRYAGFAVNMSFITNLLWYKMNKGLGANELPKNIDAVIKAKIVLSNYISQNIAYTYDECKKDFERGTITEQQFTARLVALKKRNVRPEEITFEHVEEDLDFSIDSIRRFEEENQWQKVQLQEKEQRIECLEQKVIDTQQSIDKIQKELEERKYTQNEQSILLKKQEETINKQNYIIEQFQEKKKKRGQIIKFVRDILIRIIVTIFIVIVAYFLSKLISDKMANIISTIIAIIGLIVGIKDIVKRVYKEDFNKK